MTYVLQSTNVFDKRYSAFRSEKERIDKGIKNLSEHPGHNTKFLKGEFRGKRVCRIGKIRIIFAICEECRKEGHITLNGCVDCNEMQDKTIKLFDIDNRGNVY